MTTAIKLSNISKSFPGVKANDDISFDIKQGTIHAIVGENGAGKSTLMKILYGMQKQDSGSINIFSEQVKFLSPKDAISKGIGMVHQHFMLADNLSVFESIVLGIDKASLKKMNKSKYRKEIDEKWSITYMLDGYVASTSVANNRIDYENYLEFKYKFSDNLSLTNLFDYNNFRGIEFYKMKIGLEYKL